MIRLILSGLRFYWKTHLGVLLGTMLAAAVLTGSLLVGDSVDGSLRRFALQRLGRIKYALYTPNRFIGSSLAERISPDAAAVLDLNGMAMSGERQVNQVQVIGCGPEFWQFADLTLELEPGDAAINRKLAELLGLEVGDEISIRFEKPSLLPIDAPLSDQRDERTVRGRFAVTKILSDDELGRFSLVPGQIEPCNVFINREWMQERAGMEGRCNLLVVGAVDAAPDLSSAWVPDDFDLHFRRAGSVTHLETDRVYLDPEAGRAALSIHGAEGTLTYLVNELTSGTNSTPYSFVLAQDRPGLDESGMLICRWLADELQLSEGDGVRMRYAELQPDGSFMEQQRRFVVAGILEMEDLVEEQALAPRFPGLSDVDRCSDWNVGLPMDEEALQDEDNEAYWNTYRQTPKAIVSLKAGQAMWGNRFGALTTVRWSGAADVESRFQAAYLPASAGYFFQPVREQALTAVEQAMDFGQLFVGMSFFLIVSALMLTGLLFVFGIQQRAEETGILLAVGWRPSSVRLLQMGEGVVSALPGSLAGAWLGTVYTRLLIYGLSHAWGGAVANSSIAYYARPGTVFIGGAVSLTCALIAMGIAVWRQAGHAAHDLLMADFSQEFKPLGRIPARRRVISGSVCLCAMLLSVGIVVYALAGEVKSIAMPFFGAGGLMLIAGICGISLVLRRFDTDESDWTLSRLPARNAVRRPMRSLTVIALMAAGCFLVFSVSSMKEDITGHADQPWSGTGGFRWFGQSTLPLREGLPAAVNLRVREGDDASCLNLNRATTPRLLAVDPDLLSARNAFCDGEDVWKLLQLDLADGTVPGLVGDSDTAMWGLEARVGVEKGKVIDYTDDYGRSFKVRLVGQLPMRLSVFQGTILISEEAFVERYPSESGYRMFLLDEHPDLRAYERVGLDVVPSVQRLMEFYSVESTYLSMFMVLGALGLAVGSMGMGVVVLRNVQDRRAETALLRAVGYPMATIRRLLLKEHGGLLAAGLGAGILAALLAMIPALFITRTQVSVFGMIGLLILVVMSALVCMLLAVGFAMRGDPLRGLRKE